MSAAARCWSIRKAGRSSERRGLVSEEFRAFGLEPADRLFERKRRSLGLMRLGAQRFGKGRGGPFKGDQRRAAAGPGCRLLGFVPERRPRRCRWRYARIVEHLLRGGERGQ